MKKLINVLNQFNFPKSVTFNYKVNDQNVVLNLEDALTGALNIESEDVLVESLFHIYNTTYGSDSDFEENVHNGVIDWLYDMASNIAYKEVIELSFHEVASNYEVSEKFIHFLIKNNYITKQQALCDHKFDDHYNGHADFYNSVGFCSKCLLDSDFDLFNIDEKFYKIHKVYKDWKKTNSKKRSGQI